MAQNTDLLHDVIRYTRADYTALRADLNRLPLERILDLYYGEDDREVLGLDSASDLRQRLDALRDQLIARCLEKNPHVVALLQSARSTRVWSKAAIDFLVHAADEKDRTPLPDDAISQWFKPRITTKMSPQQCHTLRDLAVLMNQRGEGWYLPIPRLGHQSAHVIVNWFRRHPALQALLDEARLTPTVVSGEVIELHAGLRYFPPISQLRLPSDLDGHAGINRAPSPCLLTATDDLMAIRAYLTKFAGQHTARAYEKEIERFLFWSICWQGKALSSLLVEDCEAYKKFIAVPPEAWCGPRKPRHSSAWRPFAGAISGASQRYTVTVLRTFFTWLVDMRYLNGNPWRGVADPRVVSHELPMQVDRALPAACWQRLSETGGLLDQLCAMSEDELRELLASQGTRRRMSMAAQMRLWRAAILLLGETGLRREEAAKALRGKLRPIPDQEQLWQLTVIGKRLKERTVIVPQYVVDALKAHWQDLGHGTGQAEDSLPLLAPTFIPDPESGQQKHLHTATGLRILKGFSADGIGKLLSKALTEIGMSPLSDTLLPAHRASLITAAAHALRHTFGTLSVADGVPLDVVQKALGHTSLQTTTIYVQAERQRLIEEYAKKHRKRAALG